MKNKKNIRLLITGGSGFIGTHAMDTALAGRITVVNCDIRPPRKASHREYWANVDIRQKDALLRAVRKFGPTHILHLAAMTGMDNENLQYFSANTDGVANLITSTFEAPNLERTVFVSSLLVCRNGYIPWSDTDHCPPNSYGKSKAIGENLIRSTSVNGQWAIVRPTSVWGPWFEHSYRRFFKLIDRNLYLHPGNAAIVKPLTFVGNTVYMMNKLLLATKESHGETFYLADYPERSIQEWANIIQRGMGARKIPTAPVAFLRLLGKAGDLLKIAGWRDPPLTTFRLQNMLTGAHYPIEKIQKVAGPLPYSMEEGVRRTIQWMHEQGQIRRAVAAS